VAQLEKRDPAPAFELLDHDGKKVALRSLLEGRLVLYFFPKADTAG